MAKNHNRVVYNESLCSGVNFAKDNEDVNSQPFIQRRDQVPTLCQSPYHSIFRKDLHDLVSLR